MAELNNCSLPDDLYFSAEHNVWVRALDDGNMEVGMTDVAQTMAGNIIHCRPKKVGAGLKAGKSVATVESGKWVGPVKAPFDGEITARNEAVEGDATLINRSPYKDGWIVRIKPADAAVEHFRAYMAENDVAGCIHCEGFEG